MICRVPRSVKKTPALFLFRRVPSTDIAKDDGRGNRKLLRCRIMLPAPYNRTTSLANPYKPCFELASPLVMSPTPPLANPYKPYFEPTYPLVMNLQPRFFNPHNPVARFFFVES